MIRPRSIFTCVLAVSAFGQLVSCAGVKPPVKSLYALDPGRPAVLGDPPPTQKVSSGPSRVLREQVLQVRRVSIAPPFDGLSLVHRAADGTYVKDYYSDWVAPPEDLFSTELVNWLSRSGPFESVVDGRSAAPHRFALEMSITSLYGDFQDRQPKVVLSARAYLLDDTTSNRSIAYQNHYDISIPVASASAQQLVLGSGRAYQQLLESMTQDLAAIRRTVVAADAR